SEASSAPVDCPRQARLRQPASLLLPGASTAQSCRSRRRRCGGIAAGRSALFPVHWVHSNGSWQDCLQSRRPFSFKVNKLVGVDQRPAKLAQRRLLQELLRQLPLAFGGSTAPRQPVGQRDSLVRGTSRSLDPDGKRVGGANRLFIIEKRQRLRRRGAPLP